MIDENKMDVDGDSLEISLNIFFTLARRFALFVISFLSSQIIRSSGFYLIILSSFSRIYHLECSQLSISGYQEDLFERYHLPWKLCSL